MSQSQSVEHYQLLGELAHGGMATVFLGRAKSRRSAPLVAIKSIRHELAEDKSFAAMFLDEATLTARIKHPNVVPTLDLASEQGKLLIVMEYVEGVSLGRLLELGAQQRTTLPPRVAVAIICDLLRGLHAAHELTDARGASLSVVHRDVSPPNVIVGTDGVARILDFGVAKASTQLHITVRGEIKGKLAYMPPEQAMGDQVDRRSDIYAAGVVLWEALVGRRLFNARTEQELIRAIFDGRIDPPSMLADEQLPSKLDHVVLRALSQARDDRWETAGQMADALAAALTPATRDEVAAVLRSVAAPDLAERARLIQSLEAADAPLDGETQRLQSFLTSRATPKPQPMPAPGPAPAPRLAPAPDVRGTGKNEKATRSAERAQRRALRHKRQRRRLLIGFIVAVVAIVILMTIALILGFKARQAHDPGPVPAQKAR